MEPGGDRSVSRFVSRANDLEERVIVIVCIAALGSCRQDSELYGPPTMEVRDRAYAGSNAQRILFEQGVATGEQDDIEVCIFHGLRHTAVSLTPRPKALISFDERNFSRARKPPPLVSWRKVAS